MGRRQHPGVRGPAPGYRRGEKLQLSAVAVVGPLPTTVGTHRVAHTDHAAGRVIGTRSCYTAVLPGTRHRVRRPGTPGSTVLRARTRTADG